MVAGEVQGLKAAPSKLHSKPVPISLEVKTKVAVLWLDGLGGSEVMLVSGADRSMSQVWLAGVVSTLPAVSRARTRKVCGPAESEEKVIGEVQGLKLAPSRPHSKLAPILLEVKAKVAVLWLVGVACTEVMLVSSPDTRMSCPVVMAPTVIVSR
jgi:hypothetical protein